MMRSSQCTRTEIFEQKNQIFFFFGGEGGWLRKVGEEIISAKMFRNVYYAPGRCAFLFVGDWSGTSDQQEQGRGSIYKQG